MLVAMPTIEVDPNLPPRDNNMGPPPWNLYFHLCVPVDLDNPRESLGSLVNRCRSTCNMAGWSKSHSLEHHSRRTQIVPKKPTFLLAPGAGPRRLEAAPQ